MGAPQMGWSVFEKTEAARNSLERAERPGGNTRASIEVPYGYLVCPLLLGWPTLSPEGETTPHRCGLAALEQDTTAKAYYAAREIDLTLIRPGDNFSSSAPVARLLVL
jgi:hypothetical protein